MKNIRLLFGGDTCFDIKVRQSPYLGAWLKRRPNESISPIVSKPVNKNKKLNLRQKIIRKLCEIWKAVKHTQTDTFKYPFPPFFELLIPSEENKDQKSISMRERNIIRFNNNILNYKDRYDLPFKKISELLKEKDIVSINLETPLTNHSRSYGLYLSNPGYAKAMVKAGITIVNLANNHIFDAGEIGFLDTISYLEDANIFICGAGKDIKSARKGSLIQNNGIKFVFLGYTQYCDLRYASIAADYPGILPLDLNLIIKDIENTKKIGDFVFINLHWGLNNKYSVHSKQIEIAHELINAGADGIIGHHSHVVQGIEIYKQKPILYSLGNFIFGHSYTYWQKDNYLAEIIVNEKKINKVKIYPISGLGKKLSQPELLDGNRANDFLSRLRQISNAFRTKIEIHDNIGYIEL